MNKEQADKKPRYTCEFCGKSYIDFALFPHQVKYHREELDKKREKEKLMLQKENEKKLEDEGYKFVGVIPAENSTLGVEMALYSNHQQSLYKGDRE